MMVKILNVMFDLGKKKRLLFSDDFDSEVAAPQGRRSSHAVLLGKSTLKRTLRACFLTSFSHYPSTSSIKIAQFSHVGQMPR